MRTSATQELQSTPSVWTPLYELTIAHGHSHRHFVTLPLVNPALDLPQLFPSLSQALASSGSALVLSDASHVPIVVGLGGL